ncbi:MAG: V-type ATP synthase subunit D [Clostridiales bacterium]|nr:V-type ATP synthase subunit D [Clostridiales bacterium]
MAQQVFPTKGNLIATKKTLALSTMGYDLMDKKRNILIREMMSLVDQAKRLRDEVDRIYDEAYEALRNANITLGMIDEIAESVPIDNGITIGFRSVMGVDIPIVKYDPQPPVLSYGMYESNSQLDNAFICFHRVKEITITLAEIENAAAGLSDAIVKTQRRANALKNVVIPNLESTVKFISDSLEEKEREEFSRLKVIKAQKASKAAR